MGRLAQLAPICLASLLFACGGGGAPPTVDPPIPDPDGPLTGGTGGAKRTNATALIDTYAPALPITYTTLTAVPTSGSATYDGYFYGSVSGGPQNLVGDLSMAVQFTASSITVTGGVTDVYDGDDTALTGSLTLGAGALDRGGDPNADATMTATLTGSLNSGSDTIAFGVQLEGDFLGGTYDAIGGAAIGTATIGSASSDFDGGFIAER